jgi:hypothetical protein
MAAWPCGPPGKATAPVGHSWNFLHLQLAAGLALMAPVAVSRAQLSGRVAFVFLAIVLAVVLAFFSGGCGDSRTLSAPVPADPSVIPTPTPDPDVILADTSTNLRRMQTARFNLVHDPGSIYVSAFSAKITDISGAWSLEQGATFLVDTYLVADHEADVDSGAYFQLKAVVTPNGYYGTEPVTGAWTKQPVSLIPIPVAELHVIMSGVLESLQNAKVTGRHDLDGIDTYRITGSAPASTLDWLLLNAEDDQSLRMEIWTDVENRWLRKVRIHGPVGRFDHPDTVREIRLYDINEALTIEPPDEFVDLTGG